MAVDTGFGTAPGDEVATAPDAAQTNAADQQALLDAAERSSGPQPPPTAVAGFEVIEHRLEDPAETGRTLEVRGRSFRLRSAVPAMLLMRLSNTQVAAQKHKGDAIKQSAALAAVHDSIVKMFDPEIQDDFSEWLVDVEPPIEMEELMSLLGKAMEAITGTPTAPASA